MGGRRAGNIVNLVGSGGKITSARRELTRAVSSENPKAIADASTRLVAVSRVGVEALRYGLKLAPYLAENAQDLERMAPRQRSEAIRNAWSKLKRQENISVSSELDSAVVSAANVAFRRRGTK